MATDTPFAAHAERARETARKAAAQGVRWLLFGLGCLVIAFGLATAFLPGHIGAPLLVIGLMIVLRQSTGAKRRFLRLQKAHPKIVFPLRRLMRRNPGGDWRRVDRLRTDDEGRASVTVRPRVDTRWKAVVRRLDWVTADTSRVHRIDNLPPGTPVRLPKAAPRPRHHLPPQPRATGEGANVVITKIPGRVWRQMTGASWHRGCPVGRSALRLVRVNYWDYGGYPRRGELVTVASAARAMGAAFAEMFRRELGVAPSEYCAR